MCYVELGKLPAPLTNDPETEFLLRVTKFCEEFRAAVFGEARKELVQHNRQQYDQLKFDIYRTCPDFRPFEDHTKYHNPAPLEEGPAEYAKPPLDLKDVQKVIDTSVALFALESPTLTSFSQFHRVGVTGPCPIPRNEGTHP
jgi:vacuolar protein sorting-associated protein 1